MLIQISPLPLFVNKLPTSFHNKTEQKTIDKGRTKSRKIFSESSVNQCEFGGLLN